MPQSWATWALARTSASSRKRSPIRISARVNRPPALAPNSTSNGQISGPCSASGTLRLLSSNATPQPLNSVWRDMRSASQPIGSCSTASPTTTVLTIASATAWLKPWRMP
ncbi:hypothetical protein D9M68_355520 [compost metagenome]